MKLKNCLALFLCFILGLSAVGCNEATSSLRSETASSAETKRSDKDYLTLLYSMSDSFNPYTVKTQINRQLCKLIYEPLVKTDNNFKPVYSIAKSVKIKGKKCTVTLNDVKFSDGSKLTAEDVKYSYNLAKESSTYYSSKLYEVKSVSSDSDTVVFNLSKEDPYFINLLDFPIIKAESEKKEDSDSVLLPPVGSGRFKVSKDRLSLVSNKYYGKSGSIKKIKLINAPDTDAVEHYASVGSADMFFSDISDGTILRTDGKKESVNLTNLIYIGVNQNYGVLKKKEARQSISSALDRAKFCQNAYYNNAVPATGFFHPDWNETKSVQNIQITATDKITVENLEKIGYNKLDEEGIRVSANGTPLELSLLVNSENRIKVAAAQLIASQLYTAGISVKVVEKKFSQYKKALKKGDFQLFLGEVKLTENMDISSMILKNGSVAYGLPKEKNGNKEDADNKNKKEEKAKTPAQIVEGFYKGEYNIKDVATVLQTEMPFIPLCYRTGVLFYNENIENVNSFSASDIYLSIDSYIYNE